MSKILTLDLGTTYFKAALFDREGTLVSLCRTPIPVTHPQPNRWEMEASKFQSTIESLCKQLAATQTEGLADVVAISYATQANSFLLLDQADRPLTPFLLWPDERAKHFEDSLHEISEADGYYSMTGVPELSSQFMVGKLLWLKKEAPDLWKQTQRVCLLSDYLTLWLTGKHVTEAGTAGLTGLMEAQDRRWWPTLLEELDLPVEWFPAIETAGCDLGPVLPDAAQSLGLSRWCHHVVGCLDQYAGAIGIGNLLPGGFSETTGTVLATVCLIDQWSPAKTPGLFQGPAFEIGEYYRMTFGNTSANLLEWYRNQLPDRPSFQSLDEAASQIGPGAEEVRVRSQPNLTDLTSVFSGMTEQATVGHCVRAILEAVAMALDTQVTRLSGSQRPSEIRSCGGAAKSDLWQQIKADTLNVPFISAECAEPTSLGAAMLAAQAIGWGSLTELASKWIHFLPPSLPGNRSSKDQPCR